MQDPDLFYPDRDATTYSTVASQAKQHCHGRITGVVCPVILECLFYGFVTEDDFGIWGGLSPRERNAVRRLGTLAKYKEIQGLVNSDYYHLVENYLEQRSDKNQKSK